jgi:hypothetical protein
MHAETISHSFEANLWQNKDPYFVSANIRPAIALEYDPGRRG